MRLRDHPAALAIAALVMVAGVSCASSESVEQDQIEATPDTASSSDDFGGDDEAAPAASSPGAASTGGGLSGSVPIATTITDLVREWDRTNFDLVDAETTGVDRVAAEIEQFGSVQISPGLAFFSAWLTKSVILGGAVNAQGQVMEVVVIVQTADPSSLAAATTTLRLAASHLDGLGSVDGLVESIAMEPVGTRRAFGSADGALIIERFGSADGQVFVAFARGVSVADFEARATGLAEAVADAAGPG